MSDSSLDRLICYHRRTLYVDNDSLVVRYDNSQNNKVDFEFHQSEVIYDFRFEYL